MSPRRRYRPPSVTTLVVLLAVVAGAMGTIGVVLAVTEHVRLSREVQRLNALAIRERAIQASQSTTLDRITGSRRQAILIVCRETEGLKVDLRRILHRFGVAPNDLPTNPRTGRRALAPLNCRTRAVELVPDPRRQHPPPAWERALELRSAAGGH